MSSRTLNPSLHLHFTIWGDRVSPARASAEEYIVLVQCASPKVGMYYVVLRLLTKPLTAMHRYN